MTVTLRNDKKVARLDIPENLWINLLQLAVTAGWSPLEPDGNASSQFSLESVNECVPWDEKLGTRPSGQHVSDEEALALARAIKSIVDIPEKEIKGPYTYTMHCVELAGKRYLEEFIKFCHQGGFDFFSWCEPDNLSQI